MKTIIINIKINGINVKNKANNGNIYHCLFMADHLS